MDGSGKSTQAKMLADYLKNEHGLEVDLTREPGGTKISEQLRGIILDNDLDKYAQFFLFQAARFEHVKKRILSGILTRKVVICDRYIDSTRIYQSEIPSGLVDLCEDLLHMKPDLTFLIDIPPSMAQERVKNRNVSNVFDDKDFDYHKKIHDKFLKLAIENKDNRFVIIDGYGTPSEVFERIKNNQSLNYCINFKKANPYLA